MEIKALGVAEVVPTFTEFPSIARLARDVVVTEKIDGTNAQIHITEDGRLFAGSRTRWIAPEADNYGFARWVQLHHAELMTLGPGSHFGEWWGSGVQRGYGLANGDKRFSLFNVGRWTSRHNNGEADAPAGEHTRCLEVPCCHVVPVLLRCAFDTAAIETALAGLIEHGSVAAPKFMNPEGIVVYHEKARVLFKKTLGNDGHKGGR